MMNPVSYLILVLGLMNVFEQVYSQHSRIVGGMNATACRSCVALTDPDDVDFVCSGGTHSERFVLMSADCCQM